MNHPDKGVQCAIANCSPSLALIKYWGKADNVQNLPATPSLAVSLRDLRTETRVWALPVAGAAGPGDRMVVNGCLQPPERHAAFFDAVRTDLGRPDLAFWAESANNFPTAAGLASSSSGFAALALGCCAAAGVVAPAGLAQGAVLGRLSRLARIGSGSAARALFGGFTLLPAGSEAAMPLHPAAHWPELRVIVVRVCEAAKAVSSRGGMEQTRQTSPYYPAWVADAPAVCDRAREALAARDLDSLGPLVRTSYLRMFATMFAADPPIIYWQPESLALIKLCERLRAEGLPAWETMDAGPQVKIFTLDSAAVQVAEAIRRELPGLECLADRAGDGPRLVDMAELLGAPSPILATAAAGLGCTLAKATSKA
jgi:diphosphomevalonate decarboxylase